MRVLVTGGAGRLGISVCKILQKKGFRVRVFDLPSPRHRRSIRELGKKVEVFWRTLPMPIPFGREWMASTR